MAGPRGHGSAHLRRARHHPAGAAHRTRGPEPHRLGPLAQPFSSSSGPFSGPTSINPTKEGFAMPTFATPEPITVTLTLTLADIRLRASERADTVLTIGPRDPSNAKDVQLAEQTRAEFA